MNSVTISAKTVEKAVEEGLLLLNTSIENVDIIIINEGGFFKKATVELTLTEEALAEKTLKLKKLEAFEYNEEESVPVSKQAVKKETKKDSQKETKKDVKIASEEVKNTNSEVVVVDEELQKIEKELEEFTKTQNHESEKKELSVEDEIKNFLNGLIYTFNINASAEVSRDENDDYLVQIIGENLGVLIGYRGETLDAIQFLLNNYIYSKTGYNKLIVLDIEKYRNKRVEVLKNMATNLANKVLSSKKSYKLEPMNKYERKIIHSHLQDVEHISTRSEGKDPFRHLIISYTE